MLRDIIKDPMSASWRTIAGRGENAEFKEKLKLLGFSVSDGGHADS
jgi:hypothetical protein